MAMPATAEFGGALDGLLITGQQGLVGGTHVASNLGWRPVEALSVGDKVLTFDHGMRPVIDIQRETLLVDPYDMPDDMRPVLVPQGVLNNRTDLWLMPDQGILVESDAAIDALGDPFAVIPARALAGMKGIQTAIPKQTLHVTLLSFEGDEVVYVEGGLLAHCPRPRRILMDDVPAEEELYDVLNPADARFLVECMGDRDASDAFAQDLTDLPQYA